MSQLAVRRGDVVLVDLKGSLGGEKHNAGPGGTDPRPCIVVQNDRGNEKSPLTIVVPLTDAGQYKGYPMQICISSDELGPGGKDSVAECGHVRTIDRDQRIVGSRVLQHLGKDTMARVGKGLALSLGL